MGSEGKRKRAPQPPSHRLIAADDLGQLKVCEVPAGNKWDATAVVQKWGQPNKEEAISHLRISAPTPDHAAGVLAMARATGNVTLLDAQDGRELTVLRPPPQAGGRPGSAGAPGCCAGLTFLPNSLDLLTVTNSGMVRVHRRAAAAAGGSDDDGAAAGPGQAAVDAASGATWVEETAFQACPSVECMALSPCGGVMAMGGEGQQLQLWELEAQTQLFHAKGGKPNRVGLVDKAHVTAVAFIPIATPAPASTSGQQQQQQQQQQGQPPQGEGQEGGHDAAGTKARFQVLVGTASRKLLLYDTGIGRRPQCEVAWGTNAITALEVDAAGQRVWCANGRGEIAAFDLRTRSMIGAIRGAGGSVRCLAIHPDQPRLMASCGLDRYVRVHSTQTRKSCAKVYLKTQLSAVVWTPVVVPPAEPEGHPDPNAAAAAAAADALGRQDAVAAAAPPAKRAAVGHGASPQRRPNPAGRRPLSASARANGPGCN